MSSRKGRGKKVRCGYFLQLVLTPGFKIYCNIGVVIFIDDI